MNEPIGFHDVQRMFETGEIYDASAADLRRCVSRLANAAIRNENVRHQAIVMTNALNAILLERLLQEQERRNKVTERWFMILAIGALVASVVQILVGIF
jgi:hypothetical protein